MRNRIVLADDHALVLDGLRRILESEYELVAMVQDGQSLVEEVERLTPDAAVCDISMPLLNGLDALSKCQTFIGRTKFIFVTANPDVALATRAFMLGASGYVLKHAATEELLLAIRECLQGRTYITPRISRPVLQNLLAGSGAGGELSPRERQVLQLIAEGMTMKEAALAMNLSPRTVEFHKNNIIEKTGLRTTAELSRYAVRTGILASD